MDIHIPSLFVGVIMAMFANFIINKYEKDICKYLDRKTKELEHFNERFK